MGLAEGVVINEENWSRVRREVRLAVAGGLLLLLLLLKLMVVPDRRSEVVDGFLDAVPESDGGGVENEPVAVVRGCGGVDIIMLIRLESGGDGRAVDAKGAEDEETGM